MQTTPAQTDLLRATWARENELRDASMYVIGQYKRGIITHSEFIQKLTEIDGEFPTPTPTTQEG